MSASQKIEMFVGVKSNKTNLFREHEKIAGIHKHLKFSNHPEKLRIKGKSTHNESYSCLAFSFDRHFCNLFKKYWKVMRCLKW